MECDISVNRLFRYLYSLIFRYQEYEYSDIDIHIFNHMIQIFTSYESILLFIDTNNAPYLATPV